MTVRVATWNINSVNARLPKLLEWLGSASPDVVCLQELKCAADAFPHEAVRELGYETAAHGTGRWNGVAVLSRIGLDDVVRGLPGQPGYLAEEAAAEDALIAPEPEQEARAIAATCGPLRVWSVYVPNGREVGHPHYAYKLRWFEALTAAVREDAAGARPFAVLGDFNVAPTDEDVWDPALFEGLTHVTPPERQALADLRDTGLADVHPRALKYDRAYTFWDYRALAFPKNRGMRIDLVYGNKPFAAAVADVYVDREARKGKGTSDHAPVVVDLTL
ncbi:exodeoxyribonuclease III [Streptacidiphilus sp. PB12-B1b]|uniref:exodeoxyribonuclease III n=1 Tax=Streptacidiphilus sp. PB12-B1b TaxID=2705012 RepID=UPI0015FB531A|nr:exodeoxyribonuclease III [Streptacidiphilus sp. PB12-B1b]QMU76198.1 exodeoxyribonuclease III [Streptacidiphilus sp. PB12-B1b]